MKTFTDQVGESSVDEGGVMEERNRKSELRVEEGGGDNGGGESRFTTGFDDVNHFT